MNPAFGPAQIRALTEIFVAKSIALRDVWAAQIDQETSTARVDVLSWLSRMTLDVIGHAGFNYQFDALVGKPNELNEAFSHIFHAGGSFWSLPVLLKLFFPPLRFIPEQDVSFRRAQATMSRIGRDLLKQSKEAAKSEKPGDRDLLSLLIKSNMSVDVPANQRMSDDDVLAQVPTFLAAGHETTRSLLINRAFLVSSTSTTWALYLLSTNPGSQSKLRDEVTSAPSDAPSMDELNALPYLDSVVREVLRSLAPIPNTGRIAMQDDVIPLGQPFVDKYGREHHELRVTKGQELVIPIMGMNKDKTLWGPDAYEFKPERWGNLPEAVSSIPGVWGNMMTFHGGSHACIGWRFALVEMKALLFTLIRAYSFELAVPKEDVLIKRAFPVIRPVVRNTEGKVGEGKVNELHGLPMLIRPVS
ncbi:hypothetical protein V5O48_003817 [Marasmius crinis-equi]|uniref:Cytochrome P450 n=1 Tax=Marasmius crinis-equi TaxID=585013 RepID=A0ABR3FRU6_9AGAR